MTRPNADVRAPSGVSRPARSAPAGAGLVPLLLFAALAILPFLPVGSYILHLSILAMVYALASTGLTGLLGYCGQYSIAQGAFMGIGAYTAAVLTTKFGVPGLAAFPLAIGLAGLFGLALGLPSLRLSGHFLAIVTISFQVIASLIIGQWYNVTGGNNGLRGIPTLLPPALTFGASRQVVSYYIALVAVAIGIFVVSRLLTSRLGQQWLAIQGDELLAKSCGMNTMHAKLGAFILSACYAGAAGALLAHYMGSTHPAEFSIWTSITLLGMVLVGGRQAILGAALGAAVLTLLPELLRSSDELRLVLYGAIIIIIVKFAPFGLLGSKIAQRTQPRT